MTLGPAVLVLAAEHASGPYRFQASRIHGQAVHTNTGNASAFRGFGNPQVILGIEQAMDELAAKCGLNPIDFREKTFFAAETVQELGILFVTMLRFHA